MRKIHDEELLQDIRQLMGAIGVAAEFDWNEDGPRAWIKDAGIVVIEDHISGSVRINQSDDPDLAAARNVLDTLNKLVTEIPHPYDQKYSLAFQTVRNVAGKVRGDACKTIGAAAEPRLEALLAEINQAFGFPILRIPSHIKPQYHYRLHIQRNNIPLVFNYLQIRKVEKIFPHDVDRARMTADQIKRNWGVTVPAT